MNVELLAIGKTKTRFVSEGMDEYLKRLKRLLPFNLTEIPDVKNASKLSHEEQKEAEGAILLGKINPGDHLVLLDERGKEYTSRGYAEKLQQLMATGKKKLVMVIGGPYGFSKDMYDRADELLSLSKMTFNHEMVRLFIIEQTYRAMTILKGQPYHHD